jgi:hypothetical protein
MYYTIYKVTNKINQKYYIGKHQTKNLNDGYMGSGKLLKKAINKYGIDNFIKEILHVFDNEVEMNAKEADLVTISEETYNLCPGGRGGWGYINSHNNAKIWKKSAGKIGGKISGNMHADKIKNDFKYKDKFVERMANCERSILNQMGSNNHMYGKTYNHNEESKEKIKNARIGKKHSKETKNKISKSLQALKTKIGTP